MDLLFKLGVLLDFVGYHHTLSVPILVLVGGSYQLQTHIQDDKAKKIISVFGITSEKN